MNVFKVLGVTLLAASVSIGLALFSERWLDDAQLETAQRPDVRSQNGLIETLPDLQLPTLSGDEVRSSRWAGKVVLVNFWATWCTSCLREIPMLNSWQQAYENDGLQIVGVAIDRPDEVALFLEDHSVLYPVLLGGIETVELTRRLGNRTGGLPFTVAFNRLGRRIFSHHGEIDSTLLEREIAPLLRRHQDG